MERNLKKVLFSLPVLLMLAAMLAVTACASSNVVTKTLTKTPSTGKTVTVTAGGSSGYSSQPAPTMILTQAPMVTVTQAAPAAGSNSIGLAAGGAKDINNFRNNIRSGYLPLPTDVTYEGLFYDYYFDTGASDSEPQDKLFYPSYSYAVTRDPLSGEVEYYLSVGLNSGLRESDFERKQLNLVIVLDNSGSMGEYFDQYYYDNTGNLVDNYAGEGERSQRKIDNAIDAVLSILGRLNDGDSFAIVLFNSDASVLHSMSRVGDTYMDFVEREVEYITAGGSTNLDAGIEAAARQFKGCSEMDSDVYENRMIVLTDAQPNTGDISSCNFMDDVEDNADRGIYTTFIGVGVDFNTDLIERITKVEGANYYTVRSAYEFSRRMNEEFDYMVTPLVFDLRFYFEADGWEIERVFGSPEADESSGTLMTINTLFPSASEGGENKGGIVLLKLRKISSHPDDEVFLRVTYKDRNGHKDSSQAAVSLTGKSAEYFGNSGIRKAVLLTRYAALLKNWTIDERSHMHYSRPWPPCIDGDTGIVLPDESAGRWERTSFDLYVSPWYRDIFDDFRDYFGREMYTIGDGSLSQELQILDKLADFE